MAMKGLSLDGAMKLKDALEAYEKAYYMGGLGWNSSAMYGKNTKLSKLIDEIIRHVYSRGSAGRNTLSSYKNQLNQIINKYSNFDNSGANTLGKVISSKNQKS